MGGSGVALTIVYLMPDSALRKARRQGDPDHISLRDNFLSNKIHLEIIIKIAREWIRVCIKKVKVRHEQNRAHPWRELKNSR